MKYKTLTKWLETAGQIHSKKWDLTLDRVLEVAKRMDLLKPNATVITVGGTNGKGSTVATLEAVAIGAGLRVGVLTSPDLLRYNERIKLNGIEASDTAICDAFAAIESARAEITLTFFEFNVLAALYIFKQHPLDLFILEVGLGGRLDATNIIDADLAIITSIDLDHQDYLGDTREKIAVEKAGILRPHRPVIIGEENPPHTLLDAIEENNAHALFYGKDFHAEETETTWNFISHFQNHTALKKPKLLIKNVSLAIAAINQLFNLDLTESQLSDIISKTTLPGRFEVIQKGDKTLIFDVAHNPAAATLLAQNVKKHFPNQRCHAVFSILSNKDHRNTITPLIELVDHWHVAELKTERKTCLTALKKCFQQLDLNQVGYYDCIELAYETAAQQASMILIFGSFHTVADVKRQLLKLE